MVTLTRLCFNEWADIQILVAANTTVIHVFNQHIWIFFFVFNFIKLPMIIYFFYFLQSVVIFLCEKILPVHKMVLYFIITITIYNEHQS